MQKVNFYTKLNCHLCDQAYLMLIDVAVDHPLKIDILDITHAHNRLESNYRERIPVIAVPQADTELAWPFTRNDVELYLNQRL
jgi:hypothetical protein